MVYKWLEISLFKHILLLKTQKDKAQDKQLRQSSPR
jgi:hypothetical protein